jgi:hypothetical protein
MVKADELIKEQKEREDKKKNTFKKILNKVEKKIIMASSANNYFAWYVIPEFIIGLPLYNLKECIEYVSKKIEKNGFKTKIYEPNFLYIEWLPSKK